jgi:hypothetical protein
MSGESHEWVGHTLFVDFLDTQFRGERALTGTERYIVT